MSKRGMRLKLNCSITMFSINRNTFFIQINSSRLIKQFELNTLIWNICIWIANCLTSKVGNFVHVIPNAVKIDKFVECFELF